MFKSLAFGIISTFLISCSDNPFGGLMNVFGYEEPLSSITFELANETDENGYIHIIADRNRFQTSYRIKGHLYRDGESMNITKMGWFSSHYWILNHYDGYINDDNYVCVVEECVSPTEEMINGYSVPIVNSASYSREDGEVNTMMSVIHMMKSDTIKISYSYYDEWKDETTSEELFVIID